uniref:Uncharacterized protein n=1 Tax=Oryza glumipatula TaxID=40148 RepID=A0A0E0AEQ4_9ORYZ
MAPTPIIPCRSVMSRPQRAPPHGLHMVRWRLSNAACLRTTSYTFCSEEMTASPAGVTVRLEYTGEVRAISPGAGSTPRQAYLSEQRIHLLFFSLLLLLGR